MWVLWSLCYFVLSNGTFGLSSVRHDPQEAGQKTGTVWLWSQGCLIQGSVKSSGLQTLLSSFEPLLPKNELNSALYNLTAVLC